MNLGLILLQAQGGQGGNSMFLIMIIVLVLMWILMMRPQRKKEKEERAFRDSLKKGDRVLFSGGIYGKVHEVGDTTVEVEVCGETIVTVEKSMIQPAPEPKSDAKK